MPVMPKVNIDGKDYELDTLSDEARNQLNMMIAADQEIARLNVLMAIAQTARAAYAARLNATLPTPLQQLQAQGETVKLD
jgi:Family of unknown function (DUF6447)